MPSWTLPTLVGLLTAALVATGAVAVVQAGAAADARQERDRLGAEIDELRAEVERLETELASRPEPAEDGGGEPLDGVLEGLLDGGLDELLDGGLDELLGGDLAAQPGAACLTPDTDGGFGDLLDGLLGSTASEPEDLKALVATTREQVEEIRAQRFVDDIDVTFLDDDATRARLRELTRLDDEDRAELATQTAVLRALRAVPDDLDLEELQQELLGDAVAGFYVEETREVVVRVPDEGLPGPADRITLAHELGHALTDQVIGLPDRAAPRYDGDPDGQRAALAVIEGDATLLMSLWTAQHLSLTEQLGMALDPAIVGQPAMLATFPEVLVRELLFPYTAGLDWACDTWSDAGGGEAGWAAIDATYADLPDTTWEILYGEPIEPAATPDLQPPSPEYGERGRSTFGAAELLWQLEAPGGDPTRALDRPRDRARAWAGGDVVVWEAGTDAAVGIALHDAGNVGDGLCSTMTRWAAAAFPDATRTDLAADTTTFDGPRSAAIGCDGGDVVVGLAGDVDVAADVLGGTASRGAGTGS